MTYNIPDELAPYLEYIPDEMLGDIITDALRAKIFSKPAAKPEAPTQLDISQLLEQMQAMSKVNPAISGKIETALAESIKAESKVVVAEVHPDLEDIPDDLKGLVEDFAAGAFK